MGLSGVYGDNPVFLLLKPIIHSASLVDVHLDR